jgi:hypothetical protein
MGRIRQVRASGTPDNRPHAVARIESIALDSAPYFPGKGVMPHEVSRLEFHRLPIPVDRDLYMRNLVREFTQSIVSQLGAERAAQFISEVGAVTGGQFDAYYRAALKSASLTREQVAEAMVDAERRIQGDFYIVEQSDEKIVLRNRACPFGNKVLDRPALCMMTSSVFGAMASKNLGYAKVELKETIARRHGQCHVVVYLKPTAEAAAAPGREFSGTAAASAADAS